METKYHKYNFYYYYVLIENTVSVESKQKHLPLCFPLSFHKLIKQ